MKLVLAVVAALVLAACTDPGQIQRDALASAMQYATNIGGKALSCSSQDSDRNGYVSCDLHDKEGRLVQVECGYGTHGGCKAKR